MVNCKPKLLIDEQIEYLKTKGVKFNIIGTDDARKYLEQNNNYFKLTAYRKNYKKHINGKDKGKYINLEFAYLIDLAVIDMRLRYVLVRMALDIEHCIKMQLINKVINSSEDGYSIVQEYMDSLSNNQKIVMNGELSKNKNNIYCGSVISKYNDNFPIWAYVEIIPFGRIISFYQFCAERFNDEEMKDNYYRLLSCKELRNAAAHNNCILNELYPRMTKRKTNYTVDRKLMEIDTITKEIRERKMSNPRIQQIITLLYVHKDRVMSEGIHKHESMELHDLTKRMFQHIDFYNDNDTITTTFKFLKIVVDNWFSYEYNDIT